MIGESFRNHFLVFHAVTLLVAALGLWMVSRRRSPILALVTLMSLGGVSWLYTTAPLSRPYGLQPGSAAAFEMALASGAAVRPNFVDSWVVGRRNPRPLVGLVWYALGGGSVERVDALYEWFGLASLLWLLLAVYLALRVSELGADSPWLALCCAFTGVFAATVPLDAFRPFGLFHRLFFVTPHRSLVLGIALLSLAVVWKRRRWSAAAGIGLGVVGWMDLNVLAWGAASLLAFDVLGAIRDRRFVGLHGLVAASVAAVISWPQLVSFSQSNLLVRGLSSDTVAQYAIAFRDVGSVSTDMEWIFFLAVAAVVGLWRQGLSEGLGLVSLVAASYLVWAFHALGFYRGTIFEPDEAFQMVRFSFALLAGVAAYRLGGWICRNRERIFGEPPGRFARWLGEQPWELVSFLLVVVALGGTSAPILWHPLRMDPDYYASLQYPIAEHDRRLASWIRDETSPSEIVLSGPVTSEWIAALSGRRVRTGIFVLPRDERRRLRRDMEAIFLSRDPAAMRAALSRLGATVLVVDDSIREVYWRMWQEEPGRLEQTGVFRRVEEIGDRYLVYRAR